MTDTNQETTEGAETPVGLGFSQQRPSYWTRAIETDSGQPSYGSPLGPEMLKGRPKGDSAEKGRPTKQTLYAEGDPAGSFVSCPTPWAGSRADGRGIHGSASQEPPCAVGLVDTIRGHYSRRGSGRGASDQVQESAHDKQSTPPSHAFL